MVGGGESRGVGGKVVSVSALGGAYGRYGAACAGKTRLKM